MLLNLSITFALCEVLSLVSAAALHVKIPASNLLPNPNTLPASTHAVLTSGSGKPLNALLRKDNSLIFSDIPTTGTHLLKIYSRDYTFAPYRVDITSGPDTTTTLISAAYETYPGTQWSDHGIPLIPTESPAIPTFTLYPKLLARRSFYESPPGFNPINLVKQNPMLLLGGVVLLFTLGLPKLIENMDPETRAEYEEMQKKSSVAGIGKMMQGQSPAAATGGSSGGAASANFDLAGYLAKASTGTSTTKTSGRDAGGDNIRERRR